MHKIIKKDNIFKDNALIIFVYVLVFYVLLLVKIDRYKKYLQGGMMKKYLFICLLCVQLMMLGMEVGCAQQNAHQHQKQQSAITRTKKRESVAKVIVMAKNKEKTSLHRSQPLSIAGSGEFVIEEKESIIELLKLSSSSDQGRSPSFSDFL